MFASFVEDIEGLKLKKEHKKICQMPVDLRAIKKAECEKHNKLIIENSESGIEKFGEPCKIYDCK